MHEADFRTRVRGPGKIHLDGPRAVRVAAGVGLAVIGISQLPGLLRPPEPEPLPADVGFRPGENPGVALPGAIPPVTAPEEVEAVPRTRRKDPRPSPKTRPGGDSERGARTNAHRKKEVERKSRAGPGSTPAGASGGGGPPPVVSPPPASSWVPPAPAPAPVDDGSSEFAPR